jgi:ankyrin repeat protein
MEVVKLLLEKGANVDVRNRDGRTALHGAVQMGIERVVRLLLEYGAAINAQDHDGNAAIHFAAEASLRTIILLLLEHGAIVEIVVTACYIFQRLAGFMYIVDSLTVP